MSNTNNELLKLGGIISSQKFKQIFELLDGEADKYYVIKASDEVGEKSEELTNIMWKMFDFARDLAEYINNKTFSAKFPESKYRDAQTEAYNNTETKTLDIDTFFECLKKFDKSRNDESEIDEAEIDEAEIDEAKKASFSKYFLHIYKLRLRDVDWRGRGVTHYVEYKKDENGNKILKEEGTYEKEYLLKYALPDTEESIKSEIEYIEDKNAEGLIYEVQDFLVMADLINKITDLVVKTNREKKGKKDYKYKFSRKDVIVNSYTEEMTIMFKLENILFLKSLNEAKVFDNMNKDYLDFYMDNKDDKPCRTAIQIKKTEFKTNEMIGKTDGENETAPNKRIAIKEYDNYLSLPSYVPLLYLGYSLDDIKNGLDKKYNQHKSYYREKKNEILNEFNPNTSSESERKTH